jgi:flagellar biosynthesis protein FlhG
MDTPVDNAEHSALVVAVGGGKGGVGKTVIAANLAVALAKLGASVVAIDADLGSANLHTMFGIDRPATTIQALIDGRSNRLDELAIDSGVPRLSLVAGSVATPGAANLQHARKLKLLRHIAKLDADVVVVDCGAGVHYNVVDFFAAADTQLLVSNAQLISLQNAYGFLKASVYRALRQFAKDPERARLLDPPARGAGTELETTSQLLARIALEDPAFAAELARELSQIQVSLLGNQLSDLRELKALSSLSRMISDFLGLRVPVLGGICRRDRIHAAVTQRRPFLFDAASDPESGTLLSLAASYLQLRGMAPKESAAEPGSKYQRQRAYARSSPTWPAVLDSESGVRPGVRRDRLRA